MTIDYLSPTRPLGRLSPKQERFAREYARSGNAKRSAVLAGYSVRSAKQVGSVLLKNPRVRLALQGLGGVTSTIPKAGMTQMWAIQQLLPETADPNPKIRLPAKKAVLQALTAIGAEVGEFECPKCAQQAVEIKSLSEDEKALRLLETTAEEISQMTPPEFREWDRRRRDPLIEAFKVARKVWEEGGGRGRKRGSESPSSPNT
jgi:hypothetical protein